MARDGKCVLLTGASGFTGRYMRAELEDEGYRVVGIGSSPEGEGEYYQTDVLDYPKLRATVTDINADIVIHLAALAFVGHGNANDFYNVNVIGSRNLLEAISTCKKIPECTLLASSANVYGNASEGQLNEEARPAPANDYAVSKLAMEYVANTWKNKLPIIVARPFNYTGVGQAKNFLLPKIIDHFHHRMETIELGNLDIFRDFSDVRTVVHLYRKLIEQPAAIGKTVNISSGKAWSLREVVAICEELAGHHLLLEVNPAFVRQNEVKTLSGDNRRLRELVGAWQAPTLRETLGWMLERAS